MSLANQPAPKEPTFADDNGNHYPEDRYEPTTRAVGTQREVAKWWAEMKVPTHTGGNLRTSTGNFKGIQRTDGSGKLKHYRHIEAIRSRTGVVISDTECYARGLAKCTKPPNLDGRAPLTSLKGDLRGKDLRLRDIESIETVEIDTSDVSKEGRLIGFINSREMVLVTGEDSSYRSQFFDEAERDQAKIILSNL